MVRRDDKRSKYKATVTIHKIQYNNRRRIKNTSVNVCKKYTCLTTIYIHPTAKYNRPTASNRNYISGCLDLQWQTTSDVRVYLLEQ